jgi:hypothetical protein
MVLNVGFDVSFVASRAGKNTGKGGAVNDTKVINKNLIVATEFSGRQWQ